MSPNSGVYGDAEPRETSQAAMRVPTIAPAMKPVSESALTITPRRQPPIAMATANSTMRASMVVTGRRNYASARFARASPDRMAQADHRRTRPRGGGVCRRRRRGSRPHGPRDHRSARLRQGFRAAQLGGDVRAAVRFGARGDDADAVHRAA